MILIIPALFTLLGLTLVLGARNALVVLIGVEILIGCGVAVLLLAGQIHAQSLFAQTFAVIALSLAAGQAALAFALVLNLYRRYQTVDFIRLRELGDPIVDE